MDPLTPLDTLCRIILRAREYEAQTAERLRPAAKTPTMSTTSRKARCPSSRTTSTTASRKSFRPRSRISARTSSPRSSPSAGSARAPMKPATGTRRWKKRRRGGRRRRRSDQRTARPADARLGARSGPRCVRSQLRRDRRRSASARKRICRDWLPRAVQIAMKAKCRRCPNGRGWNTVPATVAALARPSAATLFWIGDVRPPAATSCASAGPRKPSASSSRICVQVRRQRFERPRLRQGPSIRQSLQRRRSLHDPRKPRRAVPLRPTAEARETSSDARASGCARADNAARRSPSIHEKSRRAISAVTISAPAIRPFAAPRAARTAPPTASSPLLPRRHVAVAPGKAPQRLADAGDAAFGHDEIVQPARCCSLPWRRRSGRLRRSRSGRARATAATPGRASSPGVRSLASEAALSALLHPRLPSEPAPDAEDVEHQQHDVGPEQRRLIVISPDADPRTATPTRNTAKPVAGDSRDRGSARSWTPR